MSLQSWSPLCQFQLNATSTLLEVGTAREAEAALRLVVRSGHVECTRIGSASSLLRWTSQAVSHLPHRNKLTVAHPFHFAGAPHAALERALNTPETIRLPAGVPSG